MLACGWARTTRASRTVFTGALAKVTSAPLPRPIPWRRCSVTTALPNCVVPRISTRPGVEERGVPVGEVAEELGAAPVDAGIRKRVGHNQLGVGMVIVPRAREVASVRGLVHLAYDLHLRRFHDAGITDTARCDKRRCRLTAQRHPRVRPRDSACASGHVLTSPADARNTPPG